jgi:DNA-directed RNA polymerase
MRSRLLRTKIAGKMVKLREFTDTDEINAAKQATSISPNYVHSMDASAMILTVYALAAMGITHFAMIHDSYGTHACNTTLLASTLRKVFVEMYKEDPLARLRREIIDNNPSVDEIEPLPPKGDLNLDAVLASDFFFA